MNTLSTIVYLIGDIYFARIEIIVAAGVLFLVGGFLVLLVAVYLWEKHPLQTFVPVDGQVAQAQGSGGPEVLNYRGNVALLPYVQVMEEQIAQAGFICRTIGRHSKGGTYRLFASCWLSPQRDILVIASGGSMARTRFRLTSLESRVGPKILITRDEIGSPDLSGIVDPQIVINADFHELLRVHRARLSAMSEVATYEGNEPLQLHRENNELRADAMEACGCARYLDAERTVWRYSIRGTFVGLSAFFSWTRSFAGDKEVQRRTKLPRPGDPQYQAVEMEPE